MDYRVADDEQVLAAIKAVLREQRAVGSQAELGRRVRSVLHEADETLTASDERIRRLAVDEGLAEVRVRTGTTNEPARDECPVCSAELTRMRNLTLHGEETVVGTTCPSCPYRSGLRHEVPLRYGFEATNGARSEHRGPF